jgi:ribosomal protein S18 acetylase RimI-like enzyme
MPDIHPWAFERGTLWVRESGGDGTISVLPKVRAILGEAHPEGADVLARAMGMSDVATVIERFGGGRRCFVAQVNGAIASYAWVSRGVERIGELERSFRLSLEEAYIWDCATLPPYRSQRLYCALLSFLATYLFREGITRLWIGASASNLYSIRGFATAGFQHVLDLTYLRVLGIRQLWIRPSGDIPPGTLARARVALSV